jgi:hypothetical protein
VLVPPHRAPADLDALPDCIVDGLVRDNDVATLREGRDDARDGGEGLRVDDARGNTQVCGDVGLGLNVDILCAIETRRAAGTDAVCAERLDSLLLERLVAIEVVEVVRGEVRDGAAVGELGFGSGWAAPCQ